jgi:hypothetical protein
MSLWIWLVLAVLFIVGLSILVRNEARATRRSKTAANPLTAKRRWQ